MGIDYTAQDQARGNNSTPAPVNNPNINDPSQVIARATNIAAASSPTTPSPTTPGATPPVSPTVPNPSPVNTNATGGLPGAPIANPTGMTSAEVSADSKSVGVLSPQAQGYANAVASGKSAPQDTGTAGTTTAQFTPQDNTQPNLPQGITNYLDPTSNPAITEATKAIMDVISPPAVRDRLAKEFSQLTADQSGLSADKLQLMDMKQLMAGTSNDIRNEIQAANGFATASQVAGLTVARNATLQTQVTQLEDQISLQQDQVSTDTSIYTNDKSTTASEATMALGIMDHVQTAYQNRETAITDGLKGLIATQGMSGLYNGAMNTDPTGANAAAIATALHITPEQFQAAAADDLKTQKANQALQAGQFNIQKSQLAIQKQQLDLAKDKANPLAPGEADKSKVMSAIGKLSSAEAGKVDMNLLNTNPTYFYRVKAQLGQ